MTKPVICLMGATATGKTDIAIALRSRFPVDIVSVDSALVYRGMDIGTAKPEPDVLAAHPHQLVDILDPEESYSAGEFVADARAAIDASHAAGRIPLLAGGTMMYFRALTSGIADLPVADPALRAKIDTEASDCPMCMGLVGTLLPLNLVFYDRTLTGNFTDPMPEGVSCVDPGLDCPEAGGLGSVVLEARIEPKE